MDLKEEEVLGDKVGEHWYYRSKAAALDRLTRGLKKKSILDVGAGSGFFSKHLLQNVGVEQAICIDPNYEEERDETVAGKSLSFRRSSEQGNADLILMMDVLEHVEDDLALLKDYVDKVPVGARFVITVPAFSFLWSPHDVFLGHYRRYNLSQVSDLVDRAGLELERGCYFFGLVFPLAALVRILSKSGTGNEAEAGSDLKLHGAFVNGVLAAICRLDLLLFKHNSLGGLSVFCLARKKA